MAVAHGVALERGAVELQARRRVDGADPVLLVDRLPEDEAPAAVAALEEVVEAAGADDVALDPVHRGALRDRHLGLRGRAVAHDVDRGAAEEMEDPDASLESLAADADELVGRPLEPRRHHPAVVVPDRAKPLPVAGVAPDRPVRDQLANRLRVSARCHVRSLLLCDDRRLDER